jgi:uncharacterized protein YdhG (YjbR/CyaY superfamily)
MTTKEKTVTAAKKTDTFSKEEKAAMRARAKELRAAQNREALLQQLRDAVAEMPENDAALATRVHELVTGAAPQLTPKTWYGMPAYADADGKTVCFFKPASKFKMRYCEFGFNDLANDLDDAEMWGSAFAITGKLSDASEQRIVELVRRAAAGQ